MTDPTRETTEQRILRGVLCVSCGMPIFGAPVDKPRQCKDCKQAAVEEPTNPEYQVPPQYQGMME
jgi:predicted Zn-ribbon and HTH transcriptional regulator